ncbi:unnamed protein product [Rodentolepis nana]|uniref:Ras-GEF domain-containing protein n=1 Tax=Rodentolepis nana TaxID=102285 RepID=A0A0R3TKD7_RODNA|nr:unnamed protein product [Rodentolepis nana]
MDVGSDALERFQQTIEGALLRAEICLESSDILLNDQSPKMLTKLAEIRGLNRELSKRLFKTPSEIRNRYSGTAHSLPLNAQNIANKYQKTSKMSENEMSSSSPSSRTSSLSQFLATSLSFNLSFESDESIPAAEHPTNET